MARIYEGFTRQAADGIRRFFAQSPEQKAQELKQGAIPAMDKAGLPYSLTSQFSNDTMGEHLRIDTDLQARFTDYEEASLYPEMSCALDIYADDATTPTMETGQSIWVESKDQEVAVDLNNMLHKRVGIEDDIWGHCRETGLYGNNYGEVLVDETGVIGVNYLSPPTVRRVEDPRGTLLGFVQDVRGEFNISLEDFYTLAANRGEMTMRGRAPGEQTIFEDWEVVHWRLRTQRLRSIYGHSLLEAARYVWKRLSLLEDALLIYKLERAPSRYAFYVDVGEMDAERGLAFVNRVKNQFTRKSFVNPTTGKLDFRYNPLCLRGDTRVQLLDGSVKTIRDMAAAHDNGEEQWVWSTDLEREGRVCPGKVVWAGKTRQNAQLVRVTLDNGKTIDVTPDHKMIRRDGTKVQAQELNSGDSLMPFRRDSFWVYCPESWVDVPVGTVLGKFKSNDIRPAISDNHKVVSVEWLDEREDTYTLTVDDAHTFALDAGVFVCNSHDEDFWIPVRGGKRTTEVDIVQGPDYSETDTVEYHRDKLVAALKIPKSYMGIGGEPTRGALSTEDIRFARTVMRVQRTERMGWNKVCRIHIVARGGDPNAFEYDTKMNIPSVILDLARVEVLSAKSNVAMQMGEQISTKWILTNIYRFSEDEAVKVMEEKRQELLGRGKIDAAVQKMMEGNVIQKGSPLTDSNEIDRRLKQLEANAKRNDWRKGFDHGSRNDERRWDGKLEKLMRENRALAHRMTGLSGLMGDIRQSFRNVPAEQ